MAEQTFNSQQALGVLIQAVRIAQSKGAYSLEDAEVIAKAVKVFQPEQASTEQTEQVPTEELSPEAPAEVK